jgi:hypothetical protein
MNQKNIYLKIIQPNNAIVPILIPIKGLIGATSLGTVVTYSYKGASSKLSLVPNNLGEVAALKETINRAIVAAIKGGEQQQFYPVEIYTSNSGGLLGGWV